MNTSTTFASAYTNAENAQPAAFKDALALHQQGDVTAAIALYRQVLSGDPNHVESLINLGQALSRSEHQADKNAALDCYNKALTQPDCPATAAYNLGNLYQRAGQLEQAVQAYQQAISKQSTLHVAWFQLGNAYQRQQDTDSAIAAYTQAIGLCDDDPEYHYRRACCYLFQKDYDKAIVDASVALTFSPKHPMPLQKILGEAYYRSHRYMKSAAHYRLAHREDPDNYEHLMHLGIVLQLAGKSEEAAHFLEKARAIAPDNPTLLSNLGACYRMQGQIDEAVQCLETCVEKHPNTALAQANLAYAYYQVGQLTKGLACCEKALQIAPKDTIALMNRGLIEANQGKTGEAMATFETVLSIKPDDRAAASNLVAAATYSGELSDEQLLAYHRSWGEKAMAGITPYTEWETPLVAKPKLRIGYISADLHRHPVSYLLSSFLPYFDKEAFEVVIYASLTYRDDMVPFLKQHCHLWRDVQGLPDHILAQQIHRDKIDIMVDLGGHMAKNNLYALAYKPAPVQACFLGYPMTTGLPNMDYLIADGYVCPPEYAHLYTERIARLPQSVFSFRPYDFAPDISQTPAIAKGHITFGCYNNATKITPSVIALWSELLNAMPDAKIILKSRPLNDVGTQAHYRGLFQKNGIDPARVSLRGTSEHPEMLAEFGDIDMMLDPFPFCGGMTSLEGLWQGVPLVTLCGTRFSQRMGTMMLSNLGLTDWIADTKATYIRIAKEKASDVAKLNALRHQLRDKMRQSILCQSQVFAGQLDALYQRMWQDSGVVTT